MTKYRTKKTVVDERYICTECMGDATVALSAFKGPDNKYIIGENERLCLLCARKRGINFFGKNKTF